MKKLFVLASLFLSVIFANSQTSRTHLGIKAGVNLANLNHPTADYDTKAGLHAGLLAHIHVTNHFAVQPELVYSNQGTEYSNAGVINRTNLHYLNVPILAQYMTGGGFRLQTGPQVGFLLDAKNKVKDSETKTDVENFYKTTDFSWAFGASYITNSGFGVDARYNLGLSNINDANATKVRNSVFQVGAFYQLKH
jgi:hypothetical protein